MTTLMALALVSLTALAPPRVFSLDTVKDGCAATVRTLPEGAPRVLFTTKACPSDVKLDAAAGRAYVVDGGGIRSFALDGTGKASDIAKAPAPSSGAGDAQVWLEESGKWRAAYIVGDGVELVEGKDGKGGVVKFEGKTTPVSYENAADFPRWGSVGMAILVEHDGTAWKRIEAKPTKWEAGDTPGTGVLTTPRAPKKSVVSVAELAMKMTCVGGVLDCQSENAAARKVLGVVATGDGEDGIGMLPIEGTKAALVFKTVFGDSLHGYSPAFLCRDNCATSTVVEPNGEGRQLGFAASGGFAIVSDEYSSANAKIISATGKVVLALPSSTAVVFLPEGALPAAAVPPAPASTKTAPTK